jgi:serine/threonine protein kinase
LKVADFGIARSLSDSVSMLTMARGASGTLAYMSPQQLDGERASNLDDIYSLGATLYELLTSKPPFYSGGIERLIREKTPPSIAERRQDLAIVSNQPIPEQWEQTIAACLAKEPSSRPQSALEVVNRLHRAPFSAPTLVPPPIPPPAPLPPVSSLPAAVQTEGAPVAAGRSPYLTNQVLVIGAAVILAITGGAVWWAWSSSRETVAPRTPEVAPVLTETPA